MCSCSYNYGRTEKAYPVEEVLNVFGKSTRKLFFVRCEGYPGQNSWVPEDPLIQDGCTEAIKDFWTKSGKNPALDYYADPDGDVGMRCWMCGWKSNKRNKIRGLQMHIRRKDHKWNKKRAQQTERRDVKRKMLEAMQKLLPKVCWGELEVDNC